MVKPDLVAFASYYDRGLRTPVMAEIPLKGENPVSVIEKLGLEGTCFGLLESAKGPSNIARYSYLGFGEKLIFRSKDDLIEILKDHEGIGERERDPAPSGPFHGNPYFELKQLLDKQPGTRCGDIPGLPQYWGGAMGYFSYDMGRHFEVMPSLTEDDLKVPDAYFMFFNRVIAFDYLEGTMRIVITALPEENSDAEKAYEKACGELEIIREKLEKAWVAEDMEELKFDRALQNTFLPECNLTKEAFEDMVEKAKEYIRAGDIFQVNLSLRLAKKTGLNPFFIYKVLRQVNPSPYMSYIDFGDLQLVSSSPELLVRLRGDLAETRPIAGTRKRGLSREEDEALALELVSNEKERAEHIMLVDLERNDLGRVCLYGSVEVNELMVIEEYSHVMHIVSNVRGRLAETRDRFDLFRACFPGGTITGAPKIRSMEIIEELEPTRRGPYTGSVGFLGYAGEMEMNIVIRTILMKDGKAYVQAGAGIVADSAPEREYLESMKKAEALLRTLELAEERGGAGD